MTQPIDKGVLAKIGQFIIEGLTEEEACILSGADYNNLLTLKENNEDVRNYIAKQRVLFKHAHLREMQSKKSEKTSQWLLERLRPEDFYIGARSRTPQTINVIGTIINQIQNDTTPLISTRTREDRHQSEIESNEDSQEPGRVIEILNG
jgi:hypothetical protein